MPLNLVLSHEHEGKTSGPAAADAVTDGGPEGGTPTLKITLPALVVVCNVDPGVAQDGCDNVTRLHGSGAGPHCAPCGRPGPHQGEACTSPPGPLAPRHTGVLGVHPGAPHSEGRGYCTSHKSVVSLPLSDRFVPSTATPPAHWSPVCAADEHCVCSGQGPRGAI